VNTVVYRRGSGVVVFEPSVVAIDARTADAVGEDARRMVGRTRKYSCNAAAPQRRDR
jgi:actin-like ATPase involved in cell morphogenesis